ncbi:MAG: hypothetical protein AB3X44_06330 [Leptothrix sp. (in: b-proteobacteria)]
MTIDPVFAAAIAALSAAIGWYSVHYLTSKRDIRNDQRKQRVEYLIVTFQDLVDLRTYRSDTTRDFIPVIMRVTNNLQMFGTKEQIELFGGFARSINDAGEIRNVHKLIDLIRNDIREMIGMNQVTDPVARFEMKKIQAAPTPGETAAV